MEVIKSVSIFILTGLCEIAGGYVRRWGTSRSRWKRDGSEAYPGM